MTDEQRSQVISVGAILAEVDAIRAERDALRDRWSGLLIEQARLMALRDEAVQKRDEAIAERDEARRDGARLDWLEARKSYSLSNLGGMKCSHIYVNGGGDVSVTISTTKPTIREAIDAAIEVQP
jgi:hypothetical protein